MASSTPLQRLLLGAVVPGVQLALEVGRALGQQQLLAAQGQQVAGAGAELEMVDRAQQEVGGAGLERAVAELAVLVDGDDDDRHVDQRRPAAQGAHEAGAVHVRHVEVGDDQIGRRAAVERASASTGLAKALTAKPSSTDAASRVRMLRLVTRSSMTAILAIRPLEYIIPPERSGRLQPYDTSS